MGSVTILFGLIELVMWPFVYVKLVFHKLTMVWVYSKSYRVSRADKFMSFVVFFFFGPFIVMSNSVIDLYYFLRHMMRFDLQKIKHKTRFQMISKAHLELIHQLFESKQEKISEFKEISTKVRAGMCIVDLIQRSLFPNFNKNAIVFKTVLEKDKERFNQVNKLHQNHDELKVIEKMAEQRAEMLGKIKEYSVFKQILDRNCSMLTLSTDSLKAMEV